VFPSPSLPRDLMLLPAGLVLPGVVSITYADRVNCEIRVSRERNDGRRARCRLRMFRLEYPGSRDVNPDVVLEATQRTVSSRITFAIEHRVRSRSLLLSLSSHSPRTCSVRQVRSRNKPSQCYSARAVT
jgi:hypothetical protein